MAEGLDGVGDKPILYYVNDQSQHTYFRTRKMSDLERLHSSARKWEKIPVSAIWSEFWLMSLNDADEKRARHSTLIRLACELGGWHPRGWKQGIWREIRAMRPKYHLTWRQNAKETYEFVKKMPCIPDAWRIRREGRREGWGHGMFVIELLEVDITHCMTPQKEDWYEAFWWDTDASDYFHARIWRMNRNGFVSPLMADLNKFQKAVLSKDLSRWTHGFSFDSSAAA